MPSIYSKCQESTDKQETTLDSFLPRSEENFFATRQIHFPPEIWYNFKRSQRTAENDAHFDTTTISQLSDSEIFQSIKIHGFPIGSSFLKYLLCLHKFSLLDQIVSELGWGFFWPQEIKKDSWTRFPFDLAFDLHINSWIKDHLFLFISPSTYLNKLCTIEELWLIVTDENISSLKSANSKVQIINEHHLEYLNTINFPTQYTTHNL